MKYRTELEGFSAHHNTVAELKAWAEALHRRYGLTGKPLRVYTASWIARDGSGAQYDSAPHEIIIGI